MYDTLKNKRTQIVYQFGFFLCLGSKLDNLTPIWYNKIYELIFEEKICRKKVMKNWIN